VDCRAM